MRLLHKSMYAILEIGNSEIDDTPNLQHYIIQLNRK